MVNEQLLAAVEGHVGELEALCASIERALMRRNWSEMDAAISDSRRITHALQNAMDDAQGARSEAFDAAIMRRLRQIEAVRENQMTRLQQYQDAVGERLQVLARWKSALRSMSKPDASRSRLGCLDQLS